MVLFIHHIVKISLCCTSNIIFCDICDLVLQVAYREFLKCANFIFSMICSCNVHVRAKFHRHWVNGCRDIANC